MNILLTEISDYGVVLTLKCTLWLNDSHASSDPTLTWCPA